MRKILFNRLYITILILLLGFCANATVFTVTTLSDAGAGSLRTAITNANAAGAGTHSIVFSISGTINLASALPSVTNANVTVDGAGQNVVISANVNDVDRDCFTIGANNTVLRNVILQNTGGEGIYVNGVRTGVTIENVTIRNTINDWINHGIYVNSTSTNMTIKNVNITDIQDGFWGIRFVGAVTNLMIDGYHIYNGTGTSGRGLQIQGVANGVTVKNSNIDLNDPATTDDGDYGIYFNTTASNITIDSTQFHDCEVYPFFIAGAATNINIRNTTFDNFNGWTATQFIRFNSTTTKVYINNVSINADLKSTTDDGDYGIVFVGNAQRVVISNSTFNEIDYRAMQFGGVNTDSVIIDNNKFTNNGIGGGIGTIEFYAMRNTTSDQFPIVISNNTITGTNGIPIYLRPGDGLNYLIPNVTIKNNTITGTKGRLGAIQLNWFHNINVTQNSIYNLQGIGLDLAGSADCGYEGALKPQLLSSAQTSPGTYNLQVKMPTVCGTGNCSIEVFSTQAGMRGNAGQHYITTLTGLPSGISTRSITGAFPEMTASPYGVFTATMKVTNNSCGTSEYSNRIGIKPNGPAGVDQGVQVWLNPDILEDGNLTQDEGWIDFCGLQHNFDKIASDPARVEGGLNNNHYVNFDGNDYLYGTLYGYVKTFPAGEVITVNKSNAASTYTNGSPYDFGGNSNHHYTWSNGYIYNDFGTNDRFGWHPVTKAVIDAHPGATPTGGTINVNKWNVYGTHSGPGNWGVDFNGGQQTVQTSTNTINFSVSREYVGATAGYVFNGDIAEEALWNRVLTAKERQRVNTYYAVKYGLTLYQNYIASDSTTVWWNITTNAGYNKGIAGIARDKRSVLHQKQSRSITADDVVTIAVGNVFFPSFEDNMANIANDKSAFMWGTDSASTNFTTVFATPYSDYRMGRKWRVQKTNWSDTTIVVKLSKGNRNRSLIISADPNFVTGVASFPLNDTGAVILNSSNFANGVYFTFTNLITAPACVTLGIQSWHRADDPSATSSKWTDFSGYDREAIQATVTSQPTKIDAGMNYNPAFDFDGGDKLTIANTLGIAGTTDWTVVAAVTPESAGNSAVLGSDNATLGRAYEFRLPTGTSINSTTRSTGACGISGGVIALNTPSIVGAGRTGNTWSVYKENVSVGSTTCTNNLLGNYQIGYHTQANEYMNGKIAEIAIYNRTLSAPERAKVNSYFAFKYGITLNQATPTDYVASNGVTTMWKASDNAGYTNDIAGIGRDNCDNLYQKQSRSANAGSQFALSIGESIFTTNATNPYEVVNNNSFLTTAHNGAGANFSTAVVSTNATQRMARVWKADKTNWADTFVTIKYFGNAINTYLLISNSDPTFAAPDQEIAISSIDSTVTFKSSLLPDGGYFTFGKAVLGPGFVNNGIQGWYRADVGASVGEWSDYSGSGNDASQATATLQPVLTTGTAGNMNYQPTMKFDGVDDYMIPDNNLLGNGVAPYTVFGAGKGLGGNIFSEGATGTNQGMYARNTSPSATNDFANSGFALAGIPTTSRLMRFGYDSTTGSRFRTIVLNGGQLSATSATINFAKTGVLSFLGKGINNANFYNGYMGEVAVYNRNLTAAQSQQVESYFSVKYGITLNNGNTDYLNTNGVVTWNSATNAGFHTRVTAIGRDDKTLLNQKQSRNQDTVTIGAVTMALGNKEASNGENFNSFEDDQSFLFWADNNATGLSAATIAGDGTTTLTNGSSCLVQRRLNKTFRISEVNDVSNVQVSVNLKGVSLAASASDLYLAINSTNSFTGTISKLVQASTFVNGVAVFDGVDFTDGDFFTFVGEKAAAPGNVQANILLWLQADNGISDDGNGNVTQWDDQSAAGNNAVQATALNQPLILDNAINFNPALDFDGTNSYMDIASQLGLSTTASDFTMVGLSSRDVTGTTDAIVSQQGVTTNAGLFYFNPTNNLSFGKTNVGASTMTGTGAYATANVPMFSAATRTGNNFALYTNGAADGASTIAAGGYLNVNTRIGNRGTTADAAFSGKIGEVIVYNRALNAGELNKVHSYLAIKYGITLNPGTPTDYTASDGSTIWTGDAAYKYRITGIGKDLCSGLEQHQSVNNDVAAGTAVTNITVGLGAIAADNESNSNDFEADKSFNIWADDNGSTSFATAFPTNSYNLTYRMGRVWKVSETGTVGSVRIALPYNKVANPRKAYIVVNNGSASFTASSSFYSLDSLTINGTLSYFADVDLANNDYFTFASDVKIPGGIAGQSLWMRSDYGTSSTTDATALNEWSEFGAELNQGAQSTPASQPLYVNNTTDNVNFNPMIKFNSGTTNGIYMSLDPTLMVGGNTARTIFGIARPSIAPTTTRQIISWGTGALATATGNAMGSTGAGAGNYSANGNMPSATGLWTINNVNELTATYAGGTLGAINLYSKNKSVLVTPATRTLNTTITAGTPAYLGRSIYNATEDWNGTIGDVIVYPFELTPLQRLRVESYLSVKYGYTLDQTTPSDYLASDGSTTWSATATYKNRITGIGRDDMTGLLQRQSRNQDTTNTGYVTMALNAVAADNLSNDGVFDDDMSFLIWGDDNLNGVTTSLVSGDSSGTTIDGITSCSLTRRMAKTFRVQQTGTLNPVQIQINLKGMNMGIASDIYLAISSTPTFGSTVYALIPATSIANSVATFDGVTFNGTNQYFTVLGKKVENPASVTGSLLTWMKADDGIELNGTTVSTWQDQTLSLNNATPAAIANQPTLTSAGMNFNPTLDFDGTANSFDLNLNLNSGTNPSLTVYTVYKPDVAGAASTKYLWGNGSTATTRYLNQTNDAVGTYSNGNVIGKSFITGAQYTTAALGSNVWVNGAQAVVAPFTQLTATTGTTTMKLGAATVAAGDFFDGNIAEFMVYNRTLSAAEKTRIESYLAIKYGVTLSTGLISPLATVPDYKASDDRRLWTYDFSLTGPYNSRVFGIGQDICSDLNQKQSMSSETTGGSLSILTMGLDAIAPSNLENSGAFLADKTFVMVSDNNGAVAEQTTELPATSVTGSKRLTREWKASVTGNAPTNLELRFDLSALSPAIPGTTTAADMQLIIDNDRNGDFTNGTTTIVKASSLAGNIVTFDNVTLDSGVVFTVVTKSEPVSLACKALLQGPMGATIMTTTLNTAGLLPEAQPYANLPFNYLGTEAVTTMPSNVTDWVLVELRDAAAPATLIARRAGLVLNTGDIKDLDGASPVSFIGVPAGNYFVAIKTRNSLPVRSAGTMNFSTAAVTSYDFTTSLSKAYNVGGANTQMVLINGKWCLWTGDVNGDGSIDGSDFNTVDNEVTNGTFGYIPQDVNMDGVVDGTDFNYTDANTAQGLFYIPN